MVAAQEAQAQAILQQARVSRAGEHLGGGGGFGGGREDSSRGWKGRLEGYREGEGLGCSGAEREVGEHIRR